MYWVYQCAENQFLFGYATFDVGWAIGRCEIYEESTCGDTEWLLDDQIVCFDTVDSAKLYHS